MYLSQRREEFYFISWPGKWDHRFTHDARWGVGGTAVVPYEKGDKFYFVRYFSECRYMNRSFPLACCTCFASSSCVCFFSSLFLSRTATATRWPRLLWPSTSSPRGRVLTGLWSAESSKLREVVGASFPGYMIHESGAWSDALQKWVFMPRRISSEAYNDMKDEKVCLFYVLCVPFVVVVVVCTLMCFAAPAEAF